MDPVSRTIGRYEILRELGRGGMGVVYAARDPVGGGEVAVKVLLDLDSEVALQRFEREARVLSRLNAPHLIPVRDMGQDRGRAYLVMELVEGDSLQARLRRLGPLAPAEAAGIVRDLARTLAQVHAQGVLHRDLKPDNVLQRADGTILLTDFGLARDADEERDRLTRTGQVLGTPGYMAPEQAGGEIHVIDERVDVYGLGATLYALLTGEAPFRGTSVVNVLTAVLSKPASPPSGLRSDVDAALDAICLRCLEKEPSDRYSGALELAEALDHYLVPEPGRKGAKAPLLAAGGVVGVGLLLSGLVLWQAGPQPAGTPAPTPTTSAQTVAEVSPSPPPTAASPAVASTPSRPAGWLRVEQGELTPGPREGHEAACVYAPDRGQFLLLSGHDPAAKRPAGEPAHLWGWDGVSWELLGRGNEPHPDWRFGHAAAYDEERQVLVMYGGSDSSGQKRDGVWEWHSRDDRWENVPADPPLGVAWLGWSSMVYDPEGKRVLAFGGVPGQGVTAGLWSWERGRWTALDDGSAAPPPRQSVDLVYDLRSRRLVLFGGWNSSEGAIPHDPALWEWSESGGWTSLRADLGWPLPAQSASFTAMEEGVLLYGGFSSVHGHQGSAWIWANDHWRQLEEAPTPARLWHGAAWDSRRRVLVMYGGSDPTRATLGDLWEYRPAD